MADWERVCSSQGAPTPQPLAGNNAGHGAVSGDGANLPALLADLAAAQQGSWNARLLPSLTLLKDQLHAASARSVDADDGVKTVFSCVCVPSAVCVWMGAMGAAAGFNYVFDCIFLAASMRCVLQQRGRQLFSLRLPVMSTSQMWG